MIPLHFTRSDITQVYTLKFNPIYRVSQDLFKTGFIEEWLSDCHQNTEETVVLEHLTKGQGTSTNFILMSYQVYAARSSGISLLGYDAISQCNQFPAFWSKVTVSKQ
jgi:hypothetical protein